MALMKNDAYAQSREFAGLQRRMMEANAAPQTQPPHGLRMQEYNVLVRQDEVQEKTKGGLYLAQDTQDRDKHRQVRGTLVAVSPMAFKFDDWPLGEKKPEPGDRVLFALHGGAFTTGADGVEYRVLKDKDIVAVIDG